jgi:hypothetical protein
MFVPLCLLLLSVSVSSLYTPRRSQSNTGSRSGRSNAPRIDVNSTDVPCCPPFGPTAPPPFPAQYVTKWFTQPKDHFVRTYFIRYHDNHIELRDNAAHILTHTDPTVPLSPSLSPFLELFRPTR